MKFSERMGIVKAKDTIQLESMDDDLRFKSRSMECIHSFICK